MSPTAETIRHPALDRRPGAPLADAPLTDRARLGVVLQAAGLLSLLEAAGWRLARGFSDATVGADGALGGVAVVRGRGRRPAAELLAGLLAALFGEEAVAGRGEARRAARQLMARWRSGMLPASADAAVEQIVTAAPFLVEEPGPTARALEGSFERAGRSIAWRAGRAAGAGCCAEGARSLAARGRWAAAVRACRESPAADDEGRLLQAQVLAADGRLEAALAVIGARRDSAAEAVRLEAQLALGELGAARETLRRLERQTLPPRDRLAIGDAALRVYYLCRDFDASAEFASRLVAETRGRERRHAQLLAAMSAGDRGDLATLSRRVDELSGCADDPELAPLWREAAALQAVLRDDGPALIEQMTQKLRRGRRRMTRIQSGRAWNQLGLGRQMVGDLAGAERAFAHAMRRLDRCDGPLRVTLAGVNLAEVRLRRGQLAGVEPILAATTLANLRAGNRLGLLHDEILWVRFDLVRGDLEGALARCRRALPEAHELGGGRCVAQFVALGARAAGWLGRAEEAASLLALAGDAWRLDLEPEEHPFVLSLAGRHAAAREAAEASPFAELATPLVRGEAPRRAAWSALDALEPFRRARLVLDAETVAPGSTPRAARADAAALLRRLGAPGLAALVARDEERAWRSLGAYCARPAGDATALAELFAAVGHPEAELRLRCGTVERRLVEGAARGDAGELTAPCGEGELVLRAEAVDEPLRALFALLLRDLPGPSAVAPRAGRRSTLLGESPALATALDRLARFADSELPVLILGENGTGKELAAKLVHGGSARRARDLVPFNCAGLVESLQLSELFGHARGAFTGADRAHVGVFEQAQGSSLFLDEIGDLPLSAQGAILRALQEREIRRVGESVPRKVDVRIVAATNRDLERMVEEERFRQDLYFRLKVATVVLPPLRERGGDVLLLAEHFLDALRARRPSLRLTPEARRALAGHSWPGNVRELRHVLEAAALLTDDGRIAPEHLDLSARPAEAPASAYHRSLEDARRRMMAEALEAAAGNRAAAARRLGMSRQNFSYLAKKLGLG